MNYEEDIKINDQALDLEWLDQPALAIKYGIELVRLRKKVAVLEEKVKVIRSELINKAWEKPEKYLKQPKGSVQTVEAFYRSHKKHKKVKQELIEAQGELDFAEIAKNEISFTRKSALENLVKLFASDYFAGPNVPRDLSKIREDRKKSSEDAMKKIKKVKRSKLK